MADVGAMCSNKHSCAVVEDDGLSAAYTVAHEVNDRISWLREMSSSMTVFRTDWSRIEYDAR